MSVSQQINARLQGYPPLTALISNRVYPMQAEQGVTIPYAVYSPISETREHAMGEDAGVVVSRYQFDCYSTTYGETMHIVREIRHAMDRWRSLSGSPVITDTLIDNAIPLTKRTCIMACWTS